MAVRTVIARIEHQERFSGSYRFSGAVHPVCRGFIGGDVEIIPSLVGLILSHMVAGPSLGEQPHIVFGDHSADGFTHL